MPPAHKDQTVHHVPLVNPTPAAMVAREVATQYNNQAIALKRSGQYDAAEKLYLKSLDIKLQHWGENAVTTSLSHNALGELYIVTNRLDDAERHLGIAVTIRNAEGATFDAAVSRENLAVVYEMRGNLVAAKQMRKSTGMYACSNYNCPGQVFNRRELKQCGKCTAIYYCNPACQKADWKRHKKYCHPLE